MENRLRKVLSGKAALGFRPACILQHPHPVLLLQHQLCAVEPCRQEPHKCPQPVIRREEILLGLFNPVSPDEDQLQFSGLILQLFRHHQARQRVPFRDPGREDLADAGLLNGRRQGLHEFIHLYLFQAPGQQHRQIRIRNGSGHGQNHVHEVVEFILRRHPRLVQPPGNQVQQRGIHVHAPLIVFLGAHTDRRDIIVVPHIFGLMVKMRIAHAAKDLRRILCRFADQPFRIIGSVQHFLHQVPHDIAEGFIDGSAVIQVRSFHGDGCCHAVSELMADDIQRLPVPLVPVEGEGLEPSCLAAVISVMNGVSVLVHQVHFQQDGRSFSVRAFPSDHVVKVPYPDDALVDQQLPVVKAPVLLHPHLQVALVLPLGIIRANDLPLHVPQIPVPFRILHDRHRQRPGCPVEQRHIPAPYVRFHSLENQL